MLSSQAFRRIGESSRGLWEDARLQQLDGSGHDDTVDSLDLVFCSLAVCSAHIVF